MKTGHLIFRISEQSTLRLTTVVDDAISRSLGAVAIVISDDAGTNTITDDAGNFTLQNVQPGSRTITFTYPGYMT